MVDVAASRSRPLDGAAMVLVVLLCLCWGFNQVAVKLALPSIPPLIQCAVRTVLATGIVWSWMALRRMPVMARDGTLVPGLVSGVLFGLEFLLIYRGLLYTTASRAVLFIYLTPFFVVVGARLFLPGDRFGPMQWAGLALSFLGMVLAFGMPATAADPRQLTGDVMMIGAALAWAATIIVMKGTALAAVSPEKTLLYQLAVGGVVLVAGVLAFDEHMTGTPSAIALGSMAFQIGVAGITFIGWFALILRYSASRLSTFTFLTPLFGVAAGYLVLGEPLTPAFAVAVLLVAAGLVLVNRPR